MFPLIPAEAGIHLSDQLTAQITPIRIHAFNQTNLPGAIPFLYLPLALKRGLACFMQFIPDESLYAVIFCEARYGTLLMFPNTARQIVRYADL